MDELEDRAMKLSKDIDLFEELKKFPNNTDLDFSGRATLIVLYAARRVGLNGNGAILCKDIEEVVKRNHLDTLKHGTLMELCQRLVRSRENCKWLLHGEPDPEPKSVPKP